MLKALFLLLKAAKLGPALKTLVTMLLSVGAYALLWGWRYAAGFVALLLCHEMGHFLAARQRGLPVGTPTFIPFVGAWIQLDQMPHDVETEAYVGLAGPVVGSGAALACYFAGDAIGSDLLVALAYSGFVLNLFNLIPVSPLDGGRITAIISPRIWLLGVPILIGLFFWRPSPMLLLVALMAAPQILKVWRGQADEGLAPGYYEVSTARKAEYAAWYLGLAALLSVLCFETHEKLAHLRAS